LIVHCSELYTSFLPMISHFGCNQLQSISGITPQLSYLPSAHL